MSEKLIMEPEAIIAGFERLGYKVWARPVGELPENLWNELASGLERFHGEIAWWQGYAGLNGDLMEFIHAKVPAPCYGVCLSQFSV